MRAITASAEPAKERARRAWKGCTEVVLSAAKRRHHTASSWLNDHGGRPTRGVKGADQLARLTEEMIDAGYTLDEIDRALVEMVRGIAHAVVGTRPAA